ncbi:hypothetical protein BJ508DRAFT_360635 [Ascobolus immersus RN42]|uniref:Protein kinase domain-containing protein n=1 Tax=Ascobolus immersus RN42 TaxID=1160509 RepID=A0A3N4IAU2_ASCIM|nr:hypothetical protein BJ508DRAFT_360635 [Ascobolus immersus RN42]
MSGPEFSLSTPGADSTQTENKKTKISTSTFQPLARPVYTEDEMEMEARGYLNLTEPSAVFIAYWASQGRVYIPVSHSFEGSGGPQYGYNCNDAEEFANLGIHPLDLNDIIDGGKYRYRVYERYGFDQDQWWIVEELNNTGNVLRKLEITNGKLDEKQKRKLEETQRCYQFLMDEQKKDPLSGVRYMDVPFDCFWIDGPNGTHFCSIWDVQTCHFYDFEDNSSFIGDVVRQRRMVVEVAKALDWLHSKGVVHSAVCYGAITIAPLDAWRWTDAQVREKVNCFGIDGAMEDLDFTRFTIPVRRIDGAPITENTVPKRITLVNTVPYRECMWRYHVREDSYPFTSEPTAKLRLWCSPTFADPIIGNLDATEYVGRVVENVAPERLLGLPASIATDVWSLGSTLVPFLGRSTSSSLLSYFTSGDLGDRRRMAFAELVAFTREYPPEYIKTALEPAVLELVGADNFDGLVSWLVACMIKGRWKDVGEEHDVNLRKRWSLRDRLEEMKVLDVEEAAEVIERTWRLKPEERCSAREVVNLLPESWGKVPRYEGPVPTWWSRGKVRDSGSELR